MHVDPHTANHSYLTLAHNFNNISQCNKSQTFFHWEVSFTRKYKMTGRQMRLIVGFLAALPMQVFRCFLETRIFFPVIDYLLSTCRILPWTVLAHVSRIYSVVGGLHQSGGAVRVDASPRTKGVIASPRETKRLQNGGIAADGAAVGSFTERSVRHPKWISGTSGVSGPHNVSVVEDWVLPLGREWYSTETFKSRAVKLIVRLLHTDPHLTCL